METKNKSVYSVFSGTVYEVPEKDLDILSIDQIPLLKSPNKNCSKCYSRYYIGRDINDFSYIPCSCVRKVVDFSKYKVDLPEKV